MKGRLLIVAIAAFRVVTAVDVAAPVSNKTLAEKESLLSGIGWGPDDYDPEAGWHVGNAPSVPRLNFSFSFLSLSLLLLSIGHRPR